MTIGRTLLVAVILLGAAQAVIYVTRPDPVDVAAVAAFSQRLTVQYEEGVNIAGRMVDLEALIESYHEGEIDDGALTRTLDPELVAIGQSIENYRGGVSPDLESPAGSAARDRSMQALVAQVAGLPDMLEDQLTTLADLRTAVLAGDEVAYNRAKARSLDHSADMIAAENVGLQTSAFAVASSHPQNGYLLAVMGSNDAMEVALRILAAGFRGDDFDAASYARDVEAAMTRAEQGVTDGEAAARTMALTFEEKTGGTEQEKHGRELIVRLMGLFDRAFVIERRLVAVERKFLEALRASVEDPTMSDKMLVERIAELRVEIQQVVAERMKELYLRLELVQEFGRATQSG